MKTNMKLGQLSMFATVVLLSACGLKPAKDADADEKYTINESTANQVMQAYQSCMAKKDHTANECEQIVSAQFDNVASSGTNTPTQPVVVQNRVSPDNSWLNWYLIHSLLTSGNRTYERETVVNNYVQQSSPVRNTSKFGSGSPYSITSSTPGMKSSSMASTGTPSVKPTYSSSSQGSSSSATTYSPTVSSKPSSSSYSSSYSSSSKPSYSSSSYRTTTSFSSSSSRRK